MVSNLLYMHVNQEIPITLNNLFIFLFFIFLIAGLLLFVYGPWSSKRAI